jgi:hypothetical protein
MPHHIIDLTASPAVTPVPPHAQPSISQPTLPAGKRLPSTGASATRSIPSNGAHAGKRLPLIGQPALNETEAKRELLQDIIKDCKIDRLRTVLRDLMVKNGQVAVDWIGDALLVREEVVTPFKEGDDDMGNSDLEIPEESDEESDEDDNEENDKDEEGNSDEGGRTTAPRATTSATTAANASAGTKRLRSRYARCINCEEEFDTTSNEPGYCIWHEGIPHAFSFPSLLHLALVTDLLPLRRRNGSRLGRGLLGRS